MNLTDIHEHKGISAKQLSSTINSNVIAIQILKDELLKEHVTKIPAVLICVRGSAEYEDEQGVKFILTSGDFKEIEPGIKHWVSGIQDAQLLLIK